MGKKILKGIGYFMLVLFITTFFVYVTFPLEVLEGRIAKQIEQQMPGLRVSFGAASPWRLTGLDIEDLKLTYQQPGKDQPISATIDRVRARLGLIGLLSKRYDVSYRVDLGDGTLSGEAKVSEKATEITLDANAVNLNKPPLLARLLQADAGGEINGHIELTLDMDPKKTTGQGKLDISKARMGEYTLSTPTMPPMTMALPALDLGATSILFEVKEGTMTMKQFFLKSTDLEARLTGDIQLRKQFNTSVLNLGLQFKPSEPFLEKNSKIKTLIQLGGIERTKNPEGFYSLRVSGTPTMPKASF